MSQVIDLTGEGEDVRRISERTQQNEIPGLSIRESPRTSGTVDLTDDGDDIQFVSETRLHLPEQAYSRGNDPTPDFTNAGGSEISSQRGAYVHPGMTFGG